MIVKLKLEPRDDNDLTGVIDENIISVDIELWSGGYVRIELDYDDGKINATNISKNDAVQLAKNILSFYNVNMLIKFD